MENILNRSLRRNNSVRWEWTEVRAFKFNKKRNCRNLKKELYVLNLMEITRKLRLLIGVFFPGCHLLFEGTFPVAMQIGFILIYAFSYIHCTVPLVVQGPGRPEGSLAKDAAQQ
jgi:hypothetical protein